MSRFFVLLEFFVVNELPCSSMFSSAFHPWLRFFTIRQQR